MTYQDIQIPDETLRNQFINYWQTGSYSEALALLSNTQLTNKLNVALIWNDLTNLIVQCENLNDPTFKSNKIQVSQTPPTLISGEVYFQTI